MTLSEAIARLDQLDRTATLLRGGALRLVGAHESDGRGVEDVDAEVETLPPEAEGLTYFLEVSIALEVLEGWASHLDHEPSLDEKIERVIY